MVTENDAVAPRSTAEVPTSAPTTTGGKVGGKGAKSAWIQRPAGWRWGGSLNAWICLRVSKEISCKRQEGVMQLSYRDRPCIAWYIHVHNLSGEGFSGPSKIRASAVVSLPNIYIYTCFHDMEIDRWIDRYACMHAWIHLRWFTLVNQRHQDGSRASAAQTSAASGSSQPLGFSGSPVTWRCSKKHGFIVINDGQQPIG